MSACLECYDIERHMFENMLRDDPLFKPEWLHKFYTEYAMVEIEERWAIYWEAGIITEWVH